MIHELKGDGMKKLLTLYIFTLVTTLSIAALCYGGDSRLIQGSLLKIEGDFYTMHDSTGHEIRLHVDKSTNLEGGAFKSGDKVEAHVTAQGHVRSMVHLTASGTMSTLGSKIWKVTC